MAAVFAPLALKSLENLADSYSLDTKLLDNAAAMLKRNDPGYSVDNLVQLIRIVAHAASLGYGDYSKYFDDELIDVVINTIRTASAQDAARIIALLWNLGTDTKAVFVKRGIADALKSIPLDDCVNAPLATMLEMWCTNQQSPDIVTQIVDTILPVAARQFAAAKTYSGSDSVASWITTVSRCGDDDKLIQSNLLKIAQSGFFPALFVELNKFMGDTDNYRLKDHFLPAIAAVLNAAHNAKLDVAVKQVEACGGYNDLITISDMHHHHTIQKQALDLLVEYFPAHAPKHAGARKLGHSIAEKLHAVKDAMTPNLNFC
eukprot:TRINITY_DN107_c0_g1_i1.p1 TRINITY_DN107_c0_g1~~TRINITY_DN107_c0_g1_i1.p1  ORF type:complete len:317 (-),score=75.26 TRINITY_DN107_c0_g1_i1:153-1103(-)